MRPGSEGGYMAKTVGLNLFAIISITNKLLFIAWAKSIFTVSLDIDQRKEELCRNGH